MPKNYDFMNNFKTCVSVIIPVYNGEKYLTQAVNSVQNQKGNFIKEIILIDDGSTDNSFEIAQNLENKYQNIKLIRQQNRGQASARNVGVANSEGDLIAFLDCDDTWTPDKLITQLPLFKKDPKLVYVFANALIHPPGKNKSVVEQFSIIKPSRGFIFHNLIFGCFVNCCTVIIRRDVFLQLGGFKEDRQHKYIEDYDLWLRAAKLGQVDYAEKSMANYFRHGGSSSHSKIMTSLNVIRMVASFPVDKNMSIIKKTLALVRHSFVFLMYFFHLDRLFLPLD